MNPPLGNNRWHHGNGVLVCGTVRIAVSDFDTNPSDEFKKKMFDWICETLNKASENHLMCKKTPTPDKIKKARKQAGLTQAQAAELVHYARRSWQEWEGGEGKMHQSTWELFLIKTGGDRKANQPAAKECRDARRPPRTVA